MSNPQARMQQFLETLVRDGRERGAQLAAYVDGKLVVDAWAGVADAATGRPVDGATLFPVFSATKGITATLVHRLIERGRLTYDTPIGAVWPEFAAHGKDGIMLRHALNHTAGLQHMPQGIGQTVLRDWDTICRAVAELSPVSPPGAEMFYHAVTYGWLVGEAACRCTGRSFQQLLHEEICRPLGLTDLFVGMPDELAPRVALLDEVFEPGNEPPRPDDAHPQTVPSWMWPLTEWMNCRDTRRACVPSSNGIMTARDLARHYAALVPGGVDGIELLPAHRVRIATELQLPTVKSNEGARKQALGYVLGGSDSPMGSRATAFGHGGYGGAIGFADPEQRLAVGFTKNFCSPKGATLSVLNELRDALGIPQ